MDDPWAVDGALFTVMNGGPGSRKSFFTVMNDSAKSYEPFFKVKKGSVRLQPPVHHGEENLEQRAGRRGSV